MKRTGWFHESVKPARSGLYECRYHSKQREPDMLFFNGNVWCYEKSRNHAYFGKLLPLAGSWRGLTGPAK